MDQETQRVSTHRPKQGTVSKNALLCRDLSNDAVLARTIARRVVTVASDWYVHKVPGCGRAALTADFVGPSRSLNHGALGA